MKKIALSLSCLFLAACSGQISNTPTRPIADTPQPSSSAVRTVKLAEVDSYADQTVAAISSAAASYTARNLSLIGQVTALDYENLSLSPNDAVSTLSAKHNACLDLENKFLDGELSNYLTWFKQREFTSATICEKKLLPTIYKTNEGLLFGFVNLDFSDSSSCLEAVSRAVPRVLHMRDLILSAAAENGVGFSIEKAIENKSDNDLYALKVGVISGQKPQTAVYSTGPLFKLARWFRWEFESGFTAFLVKSNGGLSIDLSRATELKAFLKTEQTHGQNVLQAVPASQADERNIVTNQLSQIQSLVDYLNATASAQENQ